MNPDRAGRRRDRAREGLDLPAAPHPDHQRLPGRAGAEAAPGRGRLGFLPIPAGLQHPVQPALGADRLHRGDGRHPRRAGQSPLRSQEVHPRRTRCRR
jgi:hypothetical protein